MRIKRFDCVVMKHQAAEKIYRDVAGMSKEEQLDYWRQGNVSLRNEIENARRDKLMPKPHK
jgi:hypothetical protein